MFFSVALSRVVPYFVFLFDDPQVTNVNSADRALWERAYAAIAVADREGENSFNNFDLSLINTLFHSASIILHTILQSITPASSQTLYHDPTLARMQPLSPSATTETLKLLTPDMQALVVEANIKNNHAGPIATAWEAALLKAIRLPPNDSDTPPLEKTEGVEEKSENKSQERSSSLSTPHRAKNFWEKEVVEEVTVPDTDVSETPLEEKH